MLKNILNLEGALQLTKNEQKEINGGKPFPTCGDEGFWSSEDACLCQNGGHYIPNTFSCSNNQGTGRYYETATGCCYSF